MKLNNKIISYLMGLLLILNGGFMLSCILVSLYFKEGDFWYILISALITLLIGGAMVLHGREHQKVIKPREGYVIVTLGWVLMSLTGMLPYWFSGEIPNLTDAFFETVSGYTTTGATVLSDIEAVPKGLLFWRSLTHWIGGMGIIVLAVAILPILGIGGMQLFVAESPGPSADKLHPRITETARRLWLVYVALTLVETLMLWVAGMSFYDALNHAMSTMSTGGFSTKNASVAAFESPMIHYIISLFMFIAGCSFVLIYYVLKGNFKKVRASEEFRTYALSTLGLSIVVAVIIFIKTGVPAEQAFRDAIFQVLAVITTTGFVTADFTTWCTFTTVIFFMLFFVGGSAGSTSGGVKIVRHLVIFKNALAELKRQLHPSAVLPVRYNNKGVRAEIVHNIQGFFILYLLIFTIGSLAMASIGLDFDTAIGATASCLGNVGPGLGGVGPVENYGAIPLSGKWILSLLMLIGRLELFTVIILFTPYFWKKY